MRLSIIIPARNEQYLAATVADILRNAVGEVEVLVVLDGYDTPLPDDPRVVVLRKLRAEGMRPAVNDAVKLAAGKFLMKCDAHCSFAYGFDDVLTAECDSDWVVVPRRYGLDPIKWERDDSARDAHYLCWPYRDPGKAPAMRGLTWHQRALDRADVLLDDEMSSQGSCWFQHREYFLRFDGVPLDGYGPFVQEFQQIGNRTWLSGGRVVVNKKTWYSHWYKRDGQGYVLSPRQSREGIAYSADLWLHNKWDERARDIEWLVDKFWPVPSWPEDKGAWR